MYRLGHTGIALLVLAPLAYVLVEAHKPLLALITALGVLAIEPLPDLDFKLPFLDHRGVSHSLFAAVCIGGFLALCSWFATDQVVPALASVFTTVSGAVASGATTLQSVTPSGGTGRIADLFRTLAGGLAWIGSQLQGLDRQLVTGYGFAIGTGGILVHLLGDVITVSGIRPLLPISSRRVSLSSLRANSTLGNTGLFAGGVVAIAVVLSLTVGGAAVAGMPADLSPIGAAHAQDASVSTHNDPMQINSTPANQTGTQTASQNQTQNASSANATVEFTNQTTNGSAVTVERVTLPSSGFVVLDSTGPDEEGVLEESAIAVSQRLSAGTHHNVTFRVNRSPPGGVANQTTLNNTGTYEALLYHDSNNNSRFEYITSGRGADRPFVIGSGSSERLAADAARITVPQPETPTATPSIRFADQSTTGSTVTVQSVTLPDGGFVTVHNESYLRGGDPTQTAIGLSGYLPAGTHQNVSITLTNEAQQDQTLVAIPSRDTNSNQTYDYVVSDGFQDVPYTGETGAITDRASVSAAETTAQAPATTAATQTDSSQPATGEAAGSDPGVGGWLSANPLVVVAAVALVVGALISLIRRQ